MGKILFLFWQCTWGCLQTALGLFFLLYAGLRGKIRQLGFFRNALRVITASDLIRGNAFGGVALGALIFLAEPGSHELEQASRHEYGHTLQSLLLGPLYLPVIGIPSLCWNVLGEQYRRKHHVDYYTFFCEKWADHWGGVGQ